MMEEKSKSWIGKHGFGCTCNSEKVIFCFNKRTGQEAWSCSGNCFKGIKNNYSPILTRSVQVASRSTAAQTEDDPDQTTTLSNTGIETEVCGVDGNQHLLSLFTSALRVCQKLGGNEKGIANVSLNCTQHVTSGNIIYHISDATKVDLEPVPILEELKGINYNNEQDDTVCEVAVEPEGGSIPGFSKIDTGKDGCDDNNDQSTGNMSLFECILCSKVFKKEGFLTRHQKVHRKESKKEELVHEVKENEDDDDDGDNSGASDDVDDKQIEESSKNKKTDPNNDKTETSPRKKYKRKNEGHLKCDYCEDIFTHKRYYEIHIKAVHTRSLKCKHCKQVFQSDKSLAIHEKRHTEEKLKCVLCEKVVRSRYDFERHLLTHPKQKSFKCDTCNKELKSAHAFARHQARHKELQCDDCGKVYKSEERLMKHQTIHEKSKSPDPTLPPEASNRECFYCDQVCTPSEFKSHVRTHAKKKKRQGPFECTYCGKPSDSQVSHDRHLRTHTKEKPFKCTFENCEKSFAGKGELRIHIRRHTGEKPFKCERCGKAFVKKWNLDEHLRTHTGARPYKCEFCEKSFGFKNVLKVHLAQHTGEKPFRCPQCNNKYVSRILLKMHLVSHSGEKPYKCLQCDKAFVYKSGLRDHLRTHAPNR